MRDIQRQLASPTMMLGDLNSHNPSYGCEKKHKGENDSKLSYFHLFQLMLFMILDLFYN